MQVVNIPSRIFAIDYRSRGNTEMGRKSWLGRLRWGCGDSDSWVFVVILVGLGFRGRNVLVAIYRRFQHLFLRCRIRMVWSMV